MTGQPLPRDASLWLLLGGHRPAWLSVPTGRTEPIRGLPPRGNGYQLIRVAGGWAAQPFPAGNCADCAPPPLPVYYVADGSRAASRLGAADLTAPAATPGALWLVSYRPGADMSAAAGTAQEVSVTGATLGPRLRLPAGYVIDQATRAGLLLVPERAGSGPVRWELWDPDTRRVTRSFEHVIAASPAEIAWMPGCTVGCRVHVLHLPAGRVNLILCRDGSGAYGEAARQALPGAVQASDRWHLWHGLGEAVRKEVAAHSACWAGGTRLQEGKRAATTAERWQQVHELRAQNVGLLDCARRLNLSLNTVKRYDRASEPQRLQRVPKYRPTLVDPHRDHLRKRRAEEPGVPVRQLLREIRELGYQGSSNLLVRYINQGRLDSDRPHLSPRRAARILLTRPDRLTVGQQEALAGLEGACPEMTALASAVTSFAALLVPDPRNGARLRQWITGARAADLPHVHSFTRGLDLDIQAATAALTLPHHNGRAEGVNTKTKMIKRQMYGRAGFTLLRHRILLGLRSHTVTTESAPEPKT